MNKADLNVSNKNSGQIPSTESTGHDLEQEQAVAGGSEGMRPLSPETARLVARAEAIYAGRQTRTANFDGDGDLFGEPSWDLMLDLYIAHERGLDINVSRSVAASGVPTTTGLRYITLLTDRGLLCRVADPFDRRRHFVTLSDKALTIMRKLLAMI